MNCEDWSTTFEGVLMCFSSILFMSVNLYKFEFFNECIDVIEFRSVKQLLILLYKILNTNKRLYKNIEYLKVDKI